MRRGTTGFERQYRAGLKRHLVRGGLSSLRHATTLGRKAVDLGLETLSLARIHERAMIALVSPDNTHALQTTLIRRAACFFAQAVTPIEATHRSMRETNLALKNIVEKLSRSGKELATSNRRLKREIIRRRMFEAALRRSEQQSNRLLEESQHFQEQLRRLSRKLLIAQEEERKLISRELHDEIAQTLTGINVRLASLKTEAVVNTKGLQARITSAQQLVEKSVAIVHRFARDLRPTVLDDLGLIPALRSFVKQFAERTKLRVDLTITEAVEHLNSATRTALYRVAQETLTNVERHAKATRVRVDIRKEDDLICMSVSDNGKSFQVRKVLHAQGRNRLGLLGMRERVEMIGGIFGIEATPGRGTTIRATIPLHRRSLEHPLP